MRVALLCLDRKVPLGGSRGASVHLRSVAAALLRAGHDVSAIVAEPGGCPAMDGLIAKGLELRTLRQPITSREIDWHLVRVQPELVIERLALMSPEGALAAKEAGVPHLYEVNGPLDEDAAFHGYDDTAAVHEALRAGFAASGGAIAVSEEVAEWIRRFAPVGYPVRVVPNGAGPEFFATPDEATISAVARRSRLPREGLIIGFIGSFRPWHDLGTLVRAAAHVARVTPTRLLLVGDGPQRNQVLYEATHHQTPLTLTGRVPHTDVPAYLALCDLIAVPYPRADVHCSPLKLLEAMAAGRPVVASATRPLQRLMRDGHDARLVPPGDEAALAVALTELAGNPAERSRLGAEARRTVQAGHTWDAVIARVLDFALENRGRAPQPCGN